MRKPPFPLNVDVICQRLLIGLIHPRVDGGEYGLRGGVEGGLLSRHNERVGHDGGDDDDGEGVGGEHVDGQATDRVERRQEPQSVVRREPEDGLWKEV